jgi:hypothetical protein
VSFAAITLCVASQRVFIVVVYFVMTQSGYFWIHPRTIMSIFEDFNARVEHDACCRRCAAYRPNPMPTLRIKSTVF